MSQTFTPSQYIDEKKPHVIRDVRWVNSVIPEWAAAVCLTGMRPSGQLHLGHYVGALENWRKLQAESRIRCQFLVADYHVMADVGDRAKIHWSIYEVVKDWLAVGLDPKKSDFVLQSALPESTELMMLFMNLLPIWELERNPTLKAELKQLEEKKTSITAGFYNYPISQAADILLPKWTLVPVGEDQIAHIELTREIVRLFNNRYGPVFEAPYALTSHVSRLTGIDWQAKMSKSLWNAIMLADEPDTVAKKVRQMYTDPKRIRATDPGNIEGNVVFMHLDAFYTDKQHLDELKEKYQLGNVGDVELKKLLTDVLCNFLAPIRTKRKELDGSEKYIREALYEGTMRAKILAQKTMSEVREAVGLINLTSFEYCKRVPVVPDL